MLGCRRVQAAPAGAAPRWHCALSSAHASLLHASLQPALPQHGSVGMGGVRVLPPGWAPPPAAWRPRGAGGPRCRNSPPPAAPPRLSGTAPRAAGPAVGPPPRRAAPPVRTRTSSSATETSSSSSGRGKAASTASCLRHHHRRMEQAAVQSDGPTRMLGSVGGGAAGHGLGAFTRTAAAGCAAALGVCRLASPGNSILPAGWHDMHAVTAWAGCCKRVPAASCWRRLARASWNQAWRPGAVSAPISVLSHPAGPHPAP